jgi:hypothetical protein
VTTWSIVASCRSLGKVFPALGSDAGAQKALGGIFLRWSLERPFQLIVLSGLGLIFACVLERLEARLILWQWADGEPASHSVWSVSPSLATLVMIEIFLVRSA